MCGVTLGSARYQQAADAVLNFRRTRSFLDLAGDFQDAPPSGGLSRASKSFADLAVVELLDSKQLALELARLRVDESSSAASTHSSADDTSRSSPTSGYEQLMRSRSPSAVLFAQHTSAFGLKELNLCTAKQQAQGEEAEAPASGAISPAAGSPRAPGLSIDTPFTESSISFNLVEVPLASSPSSPEAEGGSPSAAVLAASDDPICAVAASQCAFAAASAAAASSTCSAASQSPFMRVPLQQSSLIAQPPSMMGHGVSFGSAAGCSSSSSPTATPSHSGSIAAEMLTRRNSQEGWGTSHHLTENHAAEELFYRLNHARQTMDFVKRQATACSALNKAAMNVWEALELLNTLREYESVLLGDAEVEPDMPLLEHALQCAEACRAAFPDEDYMHLAGLLAPLGKLLAHAKFGAEPQWAICGETFPVGCRFHPAVRHSQYFSANPDRRKRLYSSPTGVYREGCGLGGVLMSWGAGEYLHMVLRLNRVLLPAEALFCLRHQKLQCVFRPGMPYGELLNEFDRVQLPRLAKFQQLCAFQRMPQAQPLLVPAPGGGAAACGQVGGAPLVVNPALHAYYTSLMEKYIPQELLLW